MSPWTAAWLVWGAAFLVIEGWALARKAPGDTLSEATWRLFRTGPFHTAGAGWGFRAFALGAFLVWLTLHLTFGWFT